jgi:hypothetical protein
LRKLANLAVLAAACAAAVYAQGNYEVQVYGSELVPPGATMVEVHSNFTFRGTKGIAEDGTLPSEHALHETLEITHGFNEWFETGVYLFNSLQADGSWKVVGSHLRPRISIPERYRLPVGLSLSTEIGYQRPNFSPDTWSAEFRPIVDKTLGKWYLSFNPTIDVSFHGPGTSSGPEFSPNFKASYAVAKRISAGLEYYGGLGPVTGFAPLREQSQQFIPVIDVDFGPNWEFNLGVGWGVTQATDRLLVKMILGRRFGGRDR